MKLSRSERDFLAALERERVELAADVDIINAGERFERIYVMRAGWAIRHRDMANGERLIANFILPGDFMCLNAYLFDRSEYSVSTITPVTVAQFTPDRLIELTAVHPRLALAVAWASAREESIVVEHLVNVGRRNAYQRLAHLLLELWRRLELLELTRDGHFPLPVTQLELADSLGLSLSHLNRTMRRLEREKLIRIDVHAPREIWILNKKGLERAAEFDEEFLHYMEIPRRVGAFVDKLE